MPSIASGVDDVFGQVVVDLGVRQEAALLAELDQRLEAALARLDVGGRQLARRFHVLAVPALLVRGVLGALAGDPRGDFADRGLAPGNALADCRGRDCRRRGFRRRFVRLYGADLPALTGGFAFGAAALGFAGRLDFAWPRALRPTGLLPFPAGRLAAGRLLAVAGFGFRVAACFPAGFLAGDRALLAGNLRVGFTCFFAMVILVRYGTAGQGARADALFRCRRGRAVRKDNGGGAKNLKL